MAALSCIIMRANDLTILIKNRVQLTPNENKRVARGLGRSVLIELIVFVPVSAGVLLLLAPILLPETWFKKDSKAPYLHLQASIFRSIENRRFLMRSTNTGVTGLIDDRGRILLPQLNRNAVFTNIDGYLIANVAFSTQKTFYTKYGDVFAFLCLLYILIVLVKKNQFKPFHQ